MPNTNKRGRFAETSHGAQRDEKPQPRFPTFEAELDRPLRCDQAILSGGYAMRGSDSCSAKTKYAIEVRNACSEVTTRSRQESRIGFGTASQRPLIGLPETVIPRYGRVLSSSVTVTV